MRDMSETRLDSNGVPMDVDEKDAKTADKINIASSTAAAAALKLAEEKKARGNELYVKKQYAALGLVVYKSELNEAPNSLLQRSRETTQYTVQY